MPRRSKKRKAKQILVTKEKLQQLEQAKQEEVKTDKKKYKIESEIKHPNKENLITKEEDKILKPSSDQIKIQTKIDKEIKDFLKRDHEIEIRKKNNIPYKSYKKGVEGEIKYIEDQGVDLQCAGSDQWGNITAGIDLIRRSTGDEV